MRCPNPHCDDIIKYGIPGDYRDGIEVCKVCGTDLIIPEPPCEPVPAKMILVGERKMFPLYSPDDEGELTLLRSILQWAGIDYYVHNNYFGAMKAGPQIDLYNRRTLLVDEHSLQQARELLQDFDAVRSTFVPSLTRGDRFRMAVEFVLFQWFLPGKRAAGKYYKADDETL